MASGCVGKVPRDVPLLRALSLLIARGVVV
jgi:hypothetical protein